jgi:hypothetical protein
VRPFFLGIAPSAALMAGRGQGVEAGEEAARHFRRLRSLCELGLRIQEGALACREVG